MKKKRKVWVILIVLTLVIMGGLFFLRTNPVVAMFGNQRIVEVLFHVWFDVLPNYDSGRYYQALMMKHVDEFNQIVLSDPEHFNQITSLIASFIPVMEASPDDANEEARITQQQIDDLEYELDRISQVASPSLKADLESERKRFPLENFVGMTMYEVLDYVDSNWDPALTAESIPHTPFSMPPTPYATVTAYPTPVCRIGNGADCLQSPVFVDGSNDLWAYDVMDKVYFEYPGDWTVKESEPYGQALTLYFLPSAGSFEDLSTKEIILGISEATLPEDTNYDLLMCSPDGAVFPEPDALLLHESITKSDLKGNKKVWEDQGSDGIFFMESVLYSEDEKLMICLITIVDNDLTGRLSTNPELANESYSSIQHIVESIKMVNE